MNVGFISLGCSKNLVDTEMVIGLFKNNKFNIVNDPNIADIIIVNTCGFIKSAKEESINTILEMIEYKNKHCKYLIVMGCLVERYKTDLQKDIPEVDLWISIQDYDNLFNHIQKLIKKDMQYCNRLEYHNRVITTGNKTAYLKIAEGCDNKCTYCAIPYIRGKYISRPIDEILEEATRLAEIGVKELILVAQDTTKYGIDIYGKPCLSTLLEKLTKIEHIKWIRFLYAYPETITDELIKTVNSNDKICNYFDIPIQHISDKILKVMNRKSNSKSIQATINKIRENIPDVIIRTTLIVGFPGETNNDFEQLYKFVRYTKFNKLGVFKYSKEDGTPAEKLPNQIHYKTKQARYTKIMSLQKQIVYENLKDNIGKTYKVLIDNRTSDGKYYIGRTYMDVPNEDAVVYIKNIKDNLVGEFVNCKITDVIDYDLIGVIVS